MIKRVYKALSAKFDLGQLLGKGKINFLRYGTEVGELLRCFRFFAVYPYP